MEEIIRPVIELSYDFAGWDCVVSCRVQYPYTEAVLDFPFDFSALDEFTRENPAAQSVKRDVSALLTRYGELEKRHERLSHEYLLLQSALFASANTAQSLLEATSAIEALKSQLAKEKLTTNKTRQKLRERDIRKGGTELLLSQSESRVKELIYTNSLLAKKIADLEKTLRETEVRLEKNKEAADGILTVMSQRDEQVKKLILRVKSLENTVEELRNDQQKKTTQISLLNKQLKDQAADSKPRSDFELKDLKSRLQTKDTEVEILKSMLKTTHSPAKTDSTRLHQSSKLSLNSPISEVKLPVLRSSSNSKSYGAMLKRESEEAKRRTVPKALASPPKRTLRRDSSNSSGLRETHTQSPFDFQPLSAEDYGDIPEIDFNPIEEVSIELLG